MKRKDRRGRPPRPRFSLQSCFGYSVIECRGGAAAVERIVESLAGERVGELRVAHQDAALELLDRHRLERAPVPGLEPLGIQPGDTFEHMAELVVEDL